MRTQTGHRIALLTQHGKEQVLGPALASLGATLELVTGVDTDELGTFTREIPRFGTQLEAARRKARLGMERAGLPRGLASEGSFGPDPFGILPWNLEIVILVDDVEGVEVVGRAAGPARHDHATVSTLAALEAFARQADFPSHGLVVRPDDMDGRPAEKGLREPLALRAAFERALAASRHGRVHVEHDLRAHLHPSRMDRIGQAAADLVARIRSRCPACDAPGYGVVSRVTGLPCGACGRPTRAAKGERWGCLRCDQREERLATDLPPADPAVCDACNP